MKIIRTEVNLQRELKRLKSEQENLIIGFVPTMGALHNGHAQLIKKASQQSDIVMVSVFVNPAQFNNQEDLIKYPRTEEADAELLKRIDCDIMFLPSVDEVYPDSKESIKIDLNGLDFVMEGAFRPGHFDGVVTVVNRLFELVKPNKAFFGKKDFQQLAVIKRMVDVLEWNLEIIGVDIQRSDKGLALSSRNSLLTEKEKEDALIIFQTLTFGFESYKRNCPAEDLKTKMEKFFAKGNLDLEYLAIVNNESLQEVELVDENSSVCMAAYCGEVRLIDNFQFGEF